MATQPPISAQQQPEKPKPFYQTPLGVAVIAAVLAALLGIGATAFNSSRARPSSDRASITVSPPSPSAFGNYPLLVEGSGWNGDTSVKIRYPGRCMPEPTYSQGRDVLVRDGNFKFECRNVGNTLDVTEEYTVTVTGNQSGHQESDDWSLR